MKLKIGQQFEVVEVLTDGGYSFGLFKRGMTIATGSAGSRLLYTLCNGPRFYDKRIMPGEKCHNAPMINHKEVKPVGRLTVTKVK